MEDNQQNFNNYNNDYSDDYSNNSSSDNANDYSSSQNLPVLNSMGIPIEYLENQKILNEEKKGSKLPIILGVFSGIVVAAVLIAVIFISVLKYMNKETNEPMDIATAFVESFNNQDLDAFMALLPPSVTNIDTVEENLNTLFEYNMELSTDGNYTKGDILTDDELTEIKSKFSDAGSGISISAACYINYSCSYTMTYEGIYNTGDITFEIITIKMGNTWYYIGANVLEQNVTDTEEIETSEGTDNDTEYSEYEEVSEDTTENTSENTTDEQSHAEQDTTENTTEDTTESASTGSYDWVLMPFTFKGSSYNFSAFTYADISALGFSIDESFITTTLAVNEYTYSTSATNSDGLYMDIRLKNFASNEDKLITDCELLALTITSSSFSASDISINGITFGMSYDDVISIMGTPDDSYSSNDSDYATCSYDSGSGSYPNELSFVFDSEGLYEITLTNWQ